MKEGIYYSKTENRYLYLYYQKHGGCECQECGKICKKPNCFVWVDDEQYLENHVGNECIKKFKLIKVD